MAIEDYEKVFRCQKCGRPTSIYVIKNKGSEVLIKHRCPEHGGEKFTVPFKDKNFYLDLIHNGVYRCFKCGEKASLYSVEFDGPWALISCYCPTHGPDVKTQKIWSSFFVELQNPEFVASASKKSPPTENEVVKEEDISLSSDEEEDKQYCPNCGTELTGKEKFCGTCGMELISE